MRRCMMLLNELHKKGLIKPPDFILDNTHYVTIMGSLAYGVEEDYSDFDIYGFCIPPKKMVFPHLAGEINGFGRQIKKFDQWQHHHVNDESAQGGKGRQYDFSIYNIVKFFQLTMENNPNMIDSLFTPVNAVLHCTKVGSIVRENRKLFLHKGSWHKFKGYAYSTLHKLKTKKHKGLDELKEFEERHDIPHSMSFEDVEKEMKKRNNHILNHLTDQKLIEYYDLFKIVKEASSLRAEKVKSQEYDYKFAFHIVRLLNEVEQILIEHDLDLQRNREQLKSIRRGEWTLDQIVEYFQNKEKILEETYAQSNLRHSPDENAIKNLLLSCLEEHYGSLDKAIAIEGKAEKILEQIRELVKE